MKSGTVSVELLKVERATSDRIRAENDLLRARVKELESEREDSKFERDRQDA